ncbi:MAG: hypothetical protein WKF75_05085 [Singulisphaera sp.]
MPQPVVARVQGMATAAGCRWRATWPSPQTATSTPGVRIAHHAHGPARPCRPEAALEMLLTAPISVERWRWA